MKILGISNPEFVGVSVATRAICTDYYPAGHIDSGRNAEALAHSIAGFNPDILVIGGWSRGYYELVAAINKRRKFPVILINHGSPYHGKFYGEDIYLPQVLHCVTNGLADYLGFVHAPTAAYYKTVKKIPNTVFVPHYFDLKPRVKPSQTFRIGVFGGTAVPFKNVDGCLTVASDFVNNAIRHRGVHGYPDLVMQPGYNQAHEDFMRTIANCSVLIHTSHLEAYSNALQEGWSYGIPVIFSNSCKGLWGSPLVTTSVMNELTKCLVSDNVDPMELYTKLSYVRSHWEELSTGVHRSYATIRLAATNYTDALFQTIVSRYRSGNHKTDLLSQELEQEEHGAYNRF